MHTHFNLRTRVPRDGEVPYIRYAAQKLCRSRESQRLLSKS